MPQPFHLSALQRAGPLREKDPRVLQEDEEVPQVRLQRRHRLPRRPRLPRGRRLQILLKYEAKNHAEPEIQNAPEQE